MISLQELGKFSKYIATIDTSVPIPFKLDVLEYLGYNFNENMKVYGESRIGIGRLDFPVANQHQHTKYVVNFEYNF